MVVKDEAVTVWHNPRCSKSRAALAYLVERGITPDVRLYLKDAPTAEEITEMLAALGLPAEGLLRKDGSAWKGQPEDQIIAAMVSDPALIERPVIHRGDKAVIGRPTEAIASLL
jgi:arsenate reductase